MSTAGVGCLCKPLTDASVAPYGELSERMTCIETLIETYLVPASDARDPADP